MTKDPESTRANAQKPLSPYFVRKRMEQLSLPPEIHRYADLLLDCCNKDNRVSVALACEVLFPLHSKEGALEGLDNLIAHLQERINQQNSSLACCRCGKNSDKGQEEEIWFEDMSEQKDILSSPLEEKENSPRDDADDLLERSKPVVVFYQNEMMLDWVSGAVVMVDRDGRVTEANNTALNLLGWPLEQFIGRKLHSTIHHSEHDGKKYPWEFCPVFAAIEDGSSHHVNGDHFWRKDGSGFIADFIVCPARNENNDIIGAVTIFRNLTDQRLREANRVQSMKMESLGVLAAGIAHEINTPIQFIGSNLTFLEESFQSFVTLAKNYATFREKVVRLCPETEHLAQELERFEEEADIEYLQDETPLAFEQTLDGVERVTRLVLGLKGFVHSGDNSEKVLTDVNEVINNALIVSQNAYKYVADLKTDLKNLPTIKIFPGDIGQVIVNLVVNAAHALEEQVNKNGEKGKITIASDCNEKEVLISVSDTGSGIPAKLLEQIFDPFFTTKQVGLGSGQGLAISRSIIAEKHGGQLTVKSTLGKGSVFLISLPREKK